MLQALALFSYTGEGIICWHVLEMHNGINEKSLCDVKCAMSYEHARALFQAQYLVSL